MKTLLGALLLATSLLLFSPHSRAESNSFGIVRSISGEVWISNAQNTAKAVPNMRIVAGDTIRTAGTSTAGLIFEDDTVIAVGPNSEMAVKSLQFNPVEHELSFVARLAKGTFSFITGQIAKLAPKNVQIETPDATLGVRGTKFIVEID